MHKVTWDSYQCGVCGTRYETAGQAEACERAGRPEARFREGEQVRFVPDAAPDALREESFVVETSMVTLLEPAWAYTDDGGPGQPAHVVSYVLQNHLGRVSFIPEPQLTTDG